jgi:hypothetical protein
MLWKAVKECSDMLKLSDVKTACLNQRQPMNRHLCLLLVARVCYSHKLFVTPDSAINVLSDSAARVTTNTIRIDRKLKLLIPVALLLRIENEWQSAITTLLLDVVIMGVQHT